MGLPRRGTAVVVAMAAIGGAAVAWPASGSSPKPPAVRALSASGSALAFNRQRLRAPVGRVRLVLTNRSFLAHNVAIRGPKLKARRGRVVDRDGVSRVTATLPPGRYTYFCSVSGHEAAGMRGTLLVPAPKRAA